MTATIQFDVPATCANLGPGFGVLAVAVDLRLRIEATQNGEGGHTVRWTGHAPTANPDTRHDVVLRGLRAAAERLELKLPANLEVVVDSDVPPATGLGTQTAGLVGGIGIALRLAKKTPPPDELLDLAVELGADPGHASAAMLGGLNAACQLRGPQDATIVSQYRILPQPLHADWRFVLACPNVRISTADSRRILPPTLPHGVAARTAGRVIALLRALAAGDEENLADWLVDEVHVPYRRRLVPGMEAAMIAGRAAGAAGVTISGHGPAVVAMTTRQDACPTIAQAMSTAFEGAGQPATTLTLQATARGAWPAPD